MATVSPSPISMSALGDGELVGTLPPVACSGDSDSRENEADVLDIAKGMCR